MASESVPTPLGDGVCLHNDQAARPPGPRAAKRDPESAVGVVERRPDVVHLERGHLLPERQILDHEVGAAATYPPDTTGSD